MPPRENPCYLKLYGGNPHPDKTDENHTVLLGPITDLSANSHSVEVRMGNNGLCEIWYDRGRLFYDRHWYLGFEVISELAAARSTLSVQPLSQEMAAPPNDRTKHPNDTHADKRLIMMVGLPCSGKSTIASNLSKHFFAPIVCPDIVRWCMHGERSNKRMEPMVWSCVHTMVESLFRVGHNYVILDAVNTMRWHRDQWKDDRWKRVYMVMPVSAERCMRRAKTCNDIVIQPVIERMAATMEALEEDEKDDPEFQRTLDSFLEAAERL